MLKRISILMLVLLTGCVQPMSYYLEKQEREYEQKNKPIRADLQKRYAANSCDTFWRSIRTKNITSMAELANGQTCLDIMSKIHNLPSIYITDEKIAFTKSYNEFKVILSSMQNGNTPLRQGLAEFNNLYENNIRSANREISNSNSLIRK